MIRSTEDEAETIYCVVFFFEILFLFVYFGLNIELLNKQQCKKNLIVVAQASRYSKEERKTYAVER